MRSMPRCISGINAFTTILELCLPEEALTLCEALPAERTSANVASKAVNNVRLTEGPELLLAAAEGPAPQPPRTGTRAPVRTSRGVRSW
jgi:hypothetical protein